MMPIATPGTWRSRMARSTTEESIVAGHAAAAVRIRHAISTLCMLEVYTAKFLIGGAANQRYATPSAYTNGQRMPEHVPRVPLRLDPLQAHVVVLVIQLGPRHAGRVPRRIREIGVRVVDQRAIVHSAGNRNAAGLREQVAIERANPGHVLRFLA